MSRVAIQRPPDVEEDLGEPVDYNIYLPQGNQNSDDPIVEYMEDEYSTVNLMEKANRDGKQYVYGKGICLCVYVYVCM
jgi:hypothetical protein